MPQDYTHSLKRKADLSLYKNLTLTKADKICGAHLIKYNKKRKQRNLKMDKTAGAKSQTKYDIVKLARLALSKSIYILAGWLCGSCILPFGALPFGFSVLASTGKNWLFVYIGLIISAFSISELNSSLLVVGIYTALLLVRVLVRLTLDYPFSHRERRPIGELYSILFGEALGYRVLTTLIGSAAYSLCLTFSGGLLYYDLAGLFLSLLAAPLGAYLFYCFFEGRGILREAGFLAICAVCEYAAAPLKLYGVSLGLAGGMFLVFYICQKRGFILGMLCALAVGLTYSPILSPIFIFAALAFGVFHKISPSLACITTFFASVGWGYFIKGVHILNGTFAGILSACLLYAVFQKLYINTDSTGKVTSKATAVCSPLDESELDSVRLYDTNKRMWAISDGLGRLSAFFEELKLSAPKYGELIKICRDAFDSSCCGCPEYGNCGCEPHRQISELAAVLECGRQVDSSKVSRDLSLNCTRLPDILDEINYNSGVRTSRADSSAFAPDYKALSHLLTKSLEDGEDEYTIDTNLSGKLCAALGKVTGLTGAMVYGKRRRTVYIKSESISLLEEQKAQILDIMAASLPYTIDTASTEIRRCSGGAVLTASEAERLQVSFVSRQSNARGEGDFCGDSLTLFRNNDNRFFALISDGMGAGRDAATVSRICTSFICSMLDTGRMNNELLEWLNGFLCGRCEGSIKECSATVDLMELDLICGRAAFFKCGAAASYVWRDGSLIKLRSRTMPIGILERIDSKRFDLDLSAGDVVVMISDGVCGSSEECPWLFDLLRQNIDSSGTERTADLIVKYAIGHGSADDISVAIIKLS